MTRRILPHAPTATIGNTVLPVGEVVVDETLGGTLRVGDGVTPGGVVGGGAASATYLAAAAGAVASTLLRKGQDILSIFDFMTAAQIADVKAGTLLIDVTAPVQAFINAISTNTNGGAPAGYVPAGLYKITSKITIPRERITIRGDGMLASVFRCDTVVGSVFQVAAMLYFRPVFCDIGIVDETQSVTGIGFDVTLLDYVGGGQMLGFEFRNFYVKVKGNAFVCYGAFSGKFDGGLVNSSTGHGYVVSCGPSVVWLGTYSSTCGTGKAVYRLAGLVTMYSCNGMDSGSWWGIFGQDPAAVDGWQADFPAGTQSNLDYPTVRLYGCNTENFTVGGYLIHNTFKVFDVIGGSLIRSGLSSAYRCVVQARQSTAGPNGQPIKLGWDAILLGSGVPNGGAALTNAWLFAPTEEPSFADTTGTLVGAGVNGWYAAVYGGLIPFLTQGARIDRYQNMAHQFSSVSARMLTLQSNRYATSALTPVGANQAIVVTGCAKAIVTPAAAASISTATFDITLGAVSDFGRNGDLLIEAGNGNLTVNHTASGANTFRMAGAANVVMTTGQILRFCRSETSSQWVEV